MPFFFHRAHARARITHEPCGPAVRSPAPWRVAGTAPLAGTSARVLHDAGSRLLLVVCGALLVVGVLLAPAGHS